MRSSHSTQFRGSLVCGADVGAWHRVDVRRWPALARTRITFIGVLDTEAVEAIDDAVDSAEAGAHSLTLDLTQIASVTSHAFSELMTRGYQSADAPPRGELDFPGLRRTAPASPIPVSA
jgi:hypothetical protein